MGHNAQRAYDGDEERRSWIHGVSCGEYLLHQSFTATCIKSVQVGTRGRVGWTMAHLYGGTMRLRIKELPGESISAAQTKEALVPLLRSRLAAKEQRRTDRV